MSPSPPPTPARSPDAPEQRPPLAIWEAVALGLIVLVHVALDASFVGLETALPTEDGAVRIAMALRHHLDGVNYQHGFPPGTFILTGWMWSLLGMSLPTARLSMIPHVVVYVLAMAWAGRTVAGRRGGLVMALVGAGMPWLRLYSHSYFTDVPLTAAVALGFAAALASRNYRRPFPTVLVGVAIAYGMLSRWTLLFFLAVPLLALGWPALRERRDSRLAAAVTVVLGAATAAALFWLGSLEKPPPGAMGGGGLAGPDDWSFTGSGAVIGTLVALYLAWGVFVLVLGRWGLRRLRDPAGSREWDTGIGAGVAVAVGLLGCLWWYVPGAASVVGRLTEQTGDRLELVPSTRILFNLCHLAVGWWLTPVWLAAGLVAAARVPALRRVTALGLAGLVSALVLTSLIAPPAARYLMPGLVFLLLPAFAWTGRRRWTAGVTATVTATVGLLQVGWWHPALPAVLGDPVWTNGPVPISARSGGRLPRMALDTFPYPWDGYALFAVPAVPGPTTTADHFDLAPALREAASYHRSLGVLMDGTSEAMQRTLDPYLWEVVAGFEGLDLTVFVGSAAPRFLLLEADGSMSGHQYAFLPAWLTLKPLDCWWSTPRVPGAVPQARWCLYKNLSHRPR